MQIIGEKMIRINDHGLKACVLHSEGPTKQFGMN